MRLPSIFAAITPILLIGCVVPSDEVDGPPAPPEGEKGYSQADGSDCAAKGGDYARRGMLGQYSCAVPFADAGKVCTRPGDCLGQCRVEDGEATSGTCQKTSDPFGCYWYLDENGQALGICVD